MMNNINDGGPAFPRPASKGNNYITGEMNVVIDPAEGMSLRDWFAGMAMQGLLAADAKGDIDWERAALWAYGCADAMLEEREIREGK